jgi:predicted nucleic acid-binding protein
VIFADTSALFAYAMPNDSNRDRARQWVRNNSISLITTDYIIDETLTLVRARSYAARAIQLGELLFSGQVADIYYLTEEDILASWEVFRSYQDKEWSFTDCTSKVIIENSGLPRHSPSINTSASSAPLL